MFLYNGLLQGGNKYGFIENDLGKEMRKLNMKCELIDDKDSIKNTKTLIKLF